MGQHLVVVLSPFLDVDHQNLLHPERQLHEQIPLQSTRHTPRRPLLPDRAEVEPVVRVLPDILSSVSTPHPQTPGKISHHPKSPEKPIVYPQPPLLREPHRRLPLQSRSPGERLKHPFDDNGPDGRERNRGTNDKVEIVPSLHVDTL